MANVAYNAGKEGILTNINWSTSTIRAALINASHTAAITDATMATSLDADITHASHRGTDPLGSKTFSLGVANANNTVFTNAQINGDATKELICYYDASGTDTVPGTAIPLIFFDTGAASSLPVTPNGGTINVDWDNTNGVFNL